jgi:hypothetical protein
MFARLGLSALGLLLVGPLVGFAYDLRGSWQAGSLGRGTVQAAIVTQPAGGSPPVREGSLAGSYQDSPGSVGSFTEAWRLRP